MRNALALGSVMLLACVGGPGSLPDQGPDQAGQGGGITREARGPSQTDEGEDDTPRPAPTATSTPSQPPTQTSILTASEFNQSCESDADCVAVYQGLTCVSDSCRCPNGAIALADKANYDQQLASRTAACASRTGGDCSACSTTLVPVCSSNKRCSLGSQR